MNRLLNKYVGMSTCYKPTIVTRWLARRIDWLIDRLIDWRLTALSVQIGYIVPSYSKLWAIYI